MPTAAYAARFDATADAAPVAPVLIFGWGNPSRGDDALGPALVEAIAALDLPGVECLTDFQLQVEHALDLEGRSRVLFVDASIAGTPPFAVARLAAARDESFTTHAMHPRAVLQVYAELHDAPPPPAWLLTIRGERFELGEPLGAAATARLAEALAWTQAWIAQPGRSP